MDWIRNAPYKLSISRVLSTIIQVQCICGGEGLRVTAAFQVAELGGLLCVPKRWDSAASLFNPLLGSWWEESHPHCDCALSPVPDMLGHSLPERAEQVSKIDTVIACQEMAC